MFQIKTNVSGTFKTNLNACLALCTYVKLKTQFYDINFELICDLFAYCNCRSKLLSAHELCILILIYFQSFPGYFAVDKDSSPEKLVFNRIVTLRDNYGKIGK